MRTIKLLIALFIALMLGLVIFIERGEAQSSGDITRALSCDYNTFLSEVNYLELVSMSDRPMSGVVVVKGANIPFSLEPMQRIDIDIHSVVGPQQYGQISVLYGYNKSIAANGLDFWVLEPGLRGAVSEYRAGYLQATKPCAVVQFMWK